MSIQFRQASVNDAQTIAEMVISLTDEICKLTETVHFNLDLNKTYQDCVALLSNGHYTAIIAFDGAQAVAVVTIAESYALYAGGKVGIIQEFYVLPEKRALGLGTMLIEQVKAYGVSCNWSCIELCTPPLPEFEKTLNFYQKNGLNVVGGRKMRQNITTC